MTKVPKHDPERNIPNPNRIWLFALKATIALITAHENVIHRGVNNAIILLEKEKNRPFSVLFNTESRNDFLCVLSSL